MNNNEQAKKSIKKATDMSFGSAFDMICIHDNYYMRLPKWSPDVKIRVQKPDQHSKMTHPYLYVESRYGRVPWKETYPEMFSNDWELYEEVFESSKPKDDVIKICNLCGTSISNENCTHNCPGSYAMCDLYRDTVTKKNDDKEKEKKINEETDTYPCPYEFLASFPPKPVMVDKNQCSKCLRSLYCFTYNEKKKNNGEPFRKASSKPKEETSNIQNGDTFIEDMAKAILNEKDFSPFYSAMKKICEDIVNYSEGDKK